MGFYNKNTANQANVVDFVQLLVERLSPPARLTSKEVAQLLGFNEDDIAILVQRKFLVPLGSPQHNAVKYFHAQDVQALGENRKLMERAQEALYERNRAKSARAGAASVESSVEQD